MEKDVFTYTEYKLMAYMNNGRPFKREEIGSFVKSAECIFETAENGPVDKSIEVLFENGDLTREKLVEVTRKLGIDATGLLPIFELLGKDTLAETELTEFIQNFN